MAAKTVGTRPQGRYHNSTGKFASLMGAHVGIGKGASKDKPRFPTRTAEAAP